MKTQITYDDYLRLTGLLTLAADHRRSLTEIERSARNLTGDQPDGHTADAVWAGVERSAAELLEVLDIAVPSPPVEE